MRFFTKISDMGRTFLFTGVCLTLATIFAFLGKVDKAHAQPAQGYWTPTVVWGTGIGGTTNAMYANTTNIIRINNTANRLGDMVFQVTASDFTAGANTNISIQLGRSLSGVLPTNALGGTVTAYSGIETFATIPLVLNGLTPVTICTNFGCDNAAFGGANPAYYYIMWCSNSLTANPITNLSVTIYTP